MLMRARLAATRAARARGRARDAHATRRTLHPATGICAPFGMLRGHERRHGRASRTYRIPQALTYLSHLQSYGWVHAARGTLRKVLYASV
jgi:hypothetical protein